MKESLIALGKLLVSDQKLSKPVEPGVRRLHDPAPVLGRAASSAFLSCDPWGIPPYANLLANRLPVIPLIRIQEPLSPFGKGHNDGIKDCHELTDVMSVGPGNDQRQRDATAVHKDMALASLFSPGPWDSAPLPPALKAP